MRKEQIIYTLRVAQNGEVIDLLSDPTSSQETRRHMSAYYGDPPIWISGRLDKHEYDNGVVASAIVLRGEFDRIPLTRMYRDRAPYPISRGCRTTVLSHINDLRLRAQPNVARMVAAMREGDTVSVTYLHMGQQATIQGAVNVACSDPSDPVVDVGGVRFASDSALTSVALLHTYTTS